MNLTRLRGAPAYEERLRRRPTKASPRRASTLPDALWRSERAQPELFEGAVLGLVPEVLLPEAGPVPLPPIDEPPVPVVPLAPCVAPVPAPPVPLLVPDVLVV